jgi:uncharacterized protein YcbK (DUF882 family)
MGDLSKNFNKSEFACKCGCGYDDVHEDLVKVLEIIRDDIDEPIMINSGCRCEKHNKASGGVSNSQHRFGTAADIRAKDTKPKVVFQKIKDLYSAYKIPELGYCQLYSTFVHVDVREKKANTVFNG